MCCVVRGGLLLFVVNVVRFVCRLLVVSWMCVYCALLTPVVYLCADVWCSLRIACCLLCVV